MGDQARIIDDTCMTMQGLVVPLPVMALLVFVLSVVLCMLGATIDCGESPTKASWGVGGGVGWCFLLHITLFETL